MSTRSYFVALTVALMLLGLRLYFHFGALEEQGNVEIQGEIISQPYTKNEQLYFRVDRYTVITTYQNLNLGDFVAVAGKLEERRIEASSAVLIPKTGIRAVFSGLRYKLHAQIIQNLPAPQSQLLSGILLGVKSDLNKDFKDNLIKTGTLHVVVVSGYNVALVAAFGLSFSFLLGRKKASALAFVFVLCYLLLVGISAPTLRATFMASLSILAVLLGRQAIAGYLLLLTAYLMLLLNPANLVDISFQLTFLATLSLILFTKPLSTYLSKVTKWVREPLSTTLAAQVLVTPLIIFYFGNISLSSVFVNPLVLWTIPLATIGGFVYLILISFNYFLGSLIGYLLLIPLTVFVVVVEFFGGINWLSFEIESQNLLVVVGYLLVVLALVIKILQRDET